MTPNPQGRAPWWFAVILVVLAVLMFLLAPVATQALSQGSGLADGAGEWLYPLYVVLLGLCAWACYPQRRALAWILVALMALSNIMMYILC
jgi:hypothetical protein